MSQLAEVHIDLERIRANVRSIARQTNVPVIAVVKADAYGLGARPVALALRDLVEGFYTFSLAEAAAADLHRATGLPTLALEPKPLDDPAAYLEHGVRPAVWTEDNARRLQRVRPVLSVDTGMQRFAAPPDQVDAILRAGDIREAFTHATRHEHVEKLLAAAGGRGLKLHAAGTALLDEPRAYLHATRPGLAMYRGAVRVTARLVEATDSDQPAGYTGFVIPRHGVILAGYSDGLRKGPCLVNGSRRQILEVGMQSAFVELGPSDRVGDPVTLLGDGLSESDIAPAWATTPQEVLLRLAQLSTRRYTGA